MKKTTLLLLVCLLSAAAHAQYPGYPILYSWVRNLTGAVGYSNIPSNVLSVKYDTSNVYIAADCIPGYDIGPWTANPNTPSNQNFVYKITRKPVKNTGALTSIGLGHTGVWSNGVSVYNVSDAMSYNNAGVWNRNAYYFEGISFDSCLGHPAPNGEYHNHVNPICLYDERDSTRHSPIIGYAFDGYPIYGTFGYANANGTGGIKRLTSSYVVSTATTRANGPAVNSTYPAGSFIEDYHYVAGAGDLDSLNGRFCVTPEYPNGTYCYYATLGPGEKPTFPYTPYKYYYGVVQSGNANNGGHNTAPGTDTTYTAAYVPTITITVSKDTFCAGTSVTFHAAVTTGGPAPLYAWYKNGVMVGNDTAYTSSALNNHDTIQCILTSNAYYLTSSTAKSNKIVVTVNPSVTPSVSETATATTICQGNSVTFNAAAVNGGTPPVYQWVKNGTAVGSNSAAYTSSSLNNHDSVWVVLTSNAACASPASATGNKIIITVSGTVTPQVSVGANQTSICTGSTVIFTAAPVNGGTPVYQWKKNSNTVGSNNAVYTDNTLNNNDSVWVIMTSTLSCASPATATGNKVYITVSSSITPGVTIAANPSGAICAGTLVNFTANGTGGGSAPVYTWLLNGAAAGSGSTYSNSALANNDVVKCVITSNASCAVRGTDTSNALVMNVTAIPATPAVSVNTPVCSNGTLQLNTTATADSYLWTGPNSFTSTLQNPVINNPAQAYSGTYSLVVSNAGCQSAAATQAVTVNQSPAVPVITQLANVLTSSAAADNQWLLNDAPINGATAQTYTAVAAGWYSVQVSTVAGCVEVSDSVFVQPTGVVNVALQGAISISPNPFGSQFLISATSTAFEQGGLKYALTDYTGRVISEGIITYQTNQVNMNEQAAGIYLLTVYSATEKAVFKVVKVD